MPVDGSVYRPNHLIEVLVDVECGRMKYTPASCGEPGIAVLVVSLEMRFAVDFDDKMVREAREVGEIRADRMLATEANAELSTAQPTPDDPFVLGRVAAELSGALGRQ